MISKILTIKAKNKVFEKLEFGGPSELTTERGNQYK